MRAVRLILTLFVVGNLAMLPISVGMAMSHASSAAMNMSASPDGEPCCDPAGVDACPLATYCHIAALAVEAPAVARPLVAFAAAPLPGDVPLAAFGPDPPPPRS